MAIVCLFDVCARRGVKKPTRHTKPKQGEQSQRQWRQCECERRAVLNELSTIQTTRK